MSKTIFVRLEYGEDQQYEDTKQKILFFLKQRGLRVSVCRDFNGHALVKEDKPFVFRAEGEQRIIRYSQIIYFRKEKRKFRIYTTKKDYTFYGKVEQLTGILDMDQFVATHKSYIINRNRILRIEKNNVFVEGSKEIIPISRSHRKRLFEEIVHTHIKNM